MKIRFLLNYLFAITCLGVPVYAQAAELTTLATSEGLATALATQGARPILIDLRNPNEYNEGHIPGAVNIRLERLIYQLPTRDLNAVLVVYDRFGNRSGRAKTILESLGYRKVVVFGRFNKWQGPLAQRP